MINLIRIIFILSALLITVSARAYWPTSAQDPLPIRVEPNLRSNINEQCVELAGGRTLIVWNECPVYVEDIYYQVVDKYGILLFQEPAMLNPDTIISYCFDQLVSDGEGGAVIAYTDLIGLGCHIFLQRLDSLGNKLWGDTGRVVISEPLNNCIDCFDLQRDPINNTYFLYWIRKTSTGLSLQVVHKLDSDGYPIWPDAAFLSDSSGISIAGKYHNCLAPDMSGGVFVVWMRHPYQVYQYCHYLQHLDSNGNRLLQPYGSGMMIAEIGSENIYYPEICPDGHGGAYISTFPNYYHTIKRVDGAGNTLFSTIVSGIAGDNYLRQGDRDDVYVSGISVWSSNGYIRAQRLNSNGDMLWTQPYIQVFPFPMTENYAVCFNNGSLFFGSSYASGDDAYAQKIDFSGRFLWGENGVLAALYGQYWCIFTVCSDAAGGMVAFIQEEYSEDLYAQRVLSNGSLGGDNMTMEGLTAEIQGEDILLTWPDPGGVRWYNVHISQDPYSFPPSPVYIVLDTFFVHQGAVGDTVRFYQVTYER